MKKKVNSELRAEYSFSGGIRGKYAKQYAAGSNIVVLSPDVAKYFPDSKSVNGALRRVLKNSRGKKKRVSN